MTKSYLDSINFYSFVNNGLFKFGFCTVMGSLLGVGHSKNVKLIGGLSVGTACMAETLVSNQDYITSSVVGATIASAPNIMENIASTIKVSGQPGLVNGVTKVPNIIIGGMVGLIARTETIDTAKNKIIEVSHYLDPSDFYSFLVNHNIAFRFGTGMVSGVFLSTGHDIKLKLTNSVALGTACAIEPYIPYISEHQFISGAIGGALISSVGVIADEAVTVRSIGDKAVSLNKVMIGATLGICYQLPYAEQFKTWIVAPLISSAVVKSNVNSPVKYPIMLGLFTLNTVENLYPQVKVGIDYDISKAITSTAITHTIMKSSSLPKFVTLGLYPSLISVTYSNLDNLLNNKLLAHTNLSQDPRFEKILNNPAIQSKLHDIDSFNLIGTLTSYILGIKVGIYIEQLKGGITKGEALPVMVSKSNDVLIGSSISFTVQLILDSAKNSYERYLAKNVNDMMMQEWLLSQDGENILKLKASSNPSLKEKAGNVQSYVYEIFSQSSVLEREYNEALCKTLGSGVMLLKFPSWIAGIKIVADYFLNGFSSYLSFKAAENNEKIERLGEIISNLQREIFSDAELIAKSHGQEYYEKLLKSYMEPLRVLHDRKDFFQVLYSKWKIANEGLNMVFPALSMSYEIGAGTQYSGFMSDGNSKILSSSLKHLGKIFEFLANAEGSLKKLSLAKNNLSEILKIFEEENETLSHNELLNHNNNKQGIEFEDFKLLLGTKNVTIGNMFLPAGKVYSITGENGSGKSTLLDKIDGLKNTYAKSEGKIIFSYNQILVKFYITQDPIFPKYSFFESKEMNVQKFNSNTEFAAIFFYPEVPTEEQKEILKVFIYQKLKEFKFGENFKYDRKENWKDVLSGGQEQKVQHINMLVRMELEKLRNPEAKYNYIIMCDECTSAMDVEAKVKAQASLRNIPDSTILVINHDGNNENDFYDCKINFIAGQVQLEC